MGKIFVLLEKFNSTANVYLRVNENQRVRLEKRPVDHAYGKMAFVGRDNKARIIRYINGVDEIDFHKQIKELQIPANEKFTQTERDNLRFQDGVLMTEDPTVEKYLMESPEFEDNWIPEKDPEYIEGKRPKGRVVQCRDIPGPKYKVYDKSIEIESDDRMFKKRLDAGNKIFALNLTQAQELTIRLNGAHYKPSDDLLEVRRELIAFLDDSNEAMLDNLLKEEVSVDEKMRVMLSKAVNYGIISLSKKKNHIVKIKDDKVIDLKEISDEYNENQKMQYFAEFLMSQDGKMMLTDIQNEISAHEGGSKKKDAKKEKEQIPAET